MARVEFHYDIGSPNAYFCHKVLPEIEKRTGQTITYFPILLGGVFKLTNNQPPMIANQDIKNKGAYGKRQIERFIEKHKLTAFTFNPHFPVNTVKAMRGAIVADRAGWQRAYVDAMYHHMWEDPKKLDDPDVLRSALEASGLDADAVLAGIEDQSVKDALKDNTDASVARGNFGSPTFFVDDEMFFGKETLGDVEALMTAS